jgi:hypothetical protein
LAEALNRPKAGPTKGETKHFAEAMWPEGRDMKRAIMTAIVLFGTALTAQAANTATTYAFKDIAQPNGQARHVNEERADALACGVTKDGTVHNTQALLKCMLARGWAVKAITQEAQSNPMSWGTPTSDTPGIDPDKAVQDQIDADRESATKDPASPVSAAPIAQ